MLENTSRRSFVKGAAMGAAALGVAAVAGSTALADEAEGAPAEEPALNTGEVTYADTIAWDGEYDVVVLGFGGSGGFATLNAAMAGANVLAVDVAPKGAEGGDLRVAGEIFLEYDTEDDAYNFFKAQYQGIPIDDELVRFYAQELTHTGDYLVAAGMPREEFVDAESFGNYCYYDFPGLEARHMFVAHDTKYDGYIFKTVEASCAAMSDKIDLWLESPALHLIQAPDTGTVLGAEIQHNGENVKIRALNGVCLCTGGFINNQKYMQEFLNIPTGVCMGTIYDQGDGIRMSQEVGAEFWHTYAYDGPWTMYWGGACVPTPEGEMLENNNMFQAGPCCDGSIFAISDTGLRFMNELTLADHGYILTGGAWYHPNWGSKNYMVMDGQGYDELVEAGSFAEWLDQFVKADTIAELAAAIDVNPEVFQQTVDDWNNAIELGHDPIIGRDVDTMRAWGDGPYYALSIYPGIHGTRGGGRKNKDMQIISAETGEPIPHLYGAGECGSVYANLRSSGSSISECAIFGSVAGQRAAEPKDPLPEYPGGIPVLSDLRFTIGSSENDLLSTEDEFEVAENQYVGTSPNGNGGEVDVRITVENGVIESIEVVKQTETPAIGGVAFDTLIEEALAEQSADIDNVSGATFTSKAFKEALEDAMAQAGM